MAAADPAVRTITVSEDGEQGYCDNTLITSKYTALNFLGKNLREQFQRVANVYFLLIATLQVSGYITPALDLSPTHKLATISPLTLMLILTALKEAVEDYARHAEDHKVNTQKARVITGEAEPRETDWRDVRAGQILKVEGGEAFPADMILLQSRMQGETSQKCYVETAELDGETNLKIRNARKEMLQIAGRNRDSDFTWEEFCAGTVTCDLPNNELYVFEGKFHPKDGEEIPLGNECVLLRGAMLRNTEHVYGLVVYTGEETKLSKNMTEGPLKRSNVEKLVDRLIRFIFIALVIVVIMSSVFNLVFQAEMAVSDAGDRWFYLRFLAQPVHSIDALFACITFLILFNTFVPISLYVTLETVKVFQAKLVANDPEMYYEERDMWAQARTSNLHEDLGQMEYVFSDKTGTLTRNEMEFKKASFGTKEWVPDDLARDGGSTRVSDAPLSPFDREAAKQYFTLLSLCHTVVPEHKKDCAEINYQAESPDEEALVKGAAEAGYKFTKTSSVGTNEVYHIEVDSREEMYEKLAVNDFTSTRKRMSAVFKKPDGKFIVYAKGADMMMEQNCNVQIPDHARKHMEDFAVSGLRTLVVASREIEAPVFDAWKQEYDAAQVAIGNREAKLAEVAASLEQDMTYVGVTAIEDKLQEGVPDAIASLRDAGLKVWVLTGDKEETAVNIGKSCRLFDSTMAVYYVRGSEEGKVQPYTVSEIGRKIEEIKDTRETAEKEGRKLALVVDGKALGELFRERKDGDDPSPKFEDDQRQAKETLVRQAKDCAAVIGCRVSPKQKRDIVKLVKDNSLKTPMTLAIGDGANDVSMIQEAHIGVGISGNEGMQAVRSADYAIGQFKYLQRLLLVHGRWNYRRVCAVILYSFYKGIAFNLTLFCFGFFNGFSGTTLYDSWLGSGWNVIWTFLPIIFLGALDQDIPEDSAVGNPRLYLVGQDNLDLNRKKMGLFVLTALVHALILYGIVHGTFYLSITVSDGTTDGLYIMGTTLNGCLQLTVNLKILVMSRRLAFWNAIVVVGSAASWFVFVIGYSGVFALSQGKFYGVSDQLYHRESFWLLMLIAPVTAILPDIVATYLQRNYFPAPWDEKRSQIDRGAPKEQTEEERTKLLDQSPRPDLGTPTRTIGSMSGYAYNTAVAGDPEHANFEAMPDHERDSARREDKTDGDTDLASKVTEERKPFLDQDSGSSDHRIG